MAVLYESRGNIRIITIDRPEARNAIDPETNEALREVWTAFRDDDDAWVAILTATGDRAFCAGADLKAMNPEARATETGPRPPFGAITRDFELWKPTIAAINGAAFGGGLEMALACDIRVAAENAKLALSEAKWAILPGGGGTQRLPRLIPTGIALEMLFTADAMSAERAYEVGLVNRVVPQVEVLDTALAMARQIGENGPLAVRAAKEAIYEGMAMTLAEGLELEQGLSRQLFTTEDAKEGPAAFKEKRAPRYKGK